MNITVVTLGIFIELTTVIVLICFNNYTCSSHFAKYRHYAEYSHSIDYIIVIIDIVVQTTVLTFN